MANVPKTLTEYEIHFAAQAQGISPELKRKIYLLGFRDDGLVGQGAIFNPKTNLHYLSCPLIDLHVTWDCYDKSSYLQKKAEFQNLLEYHGKDCIGYSHAEIIKPEWDIDLEHKPFSSAILFPIEYFDPVPSTVPKKWDIHISAFVNSLDSELENVLFSKAGMYFIDVKKASGQVVRVFTIQGTNKIQEGYQLFERIVKYLENAGGMKGSVKFEQTIFWGVYGNPQIVPPVIDNIRYTV